jgi:integrase
MNKVFHTRVYPVFQMIGGKRTLVNHRGYFTLEQNGARHWKALGTPSREIAQKRIMEVALQAQRVQEGLVAPDVQTNTASKPILSIVDEYEQYLRGGRRASKHVHDTTARLRLMASEIGWHRLQDIQPDSFQSWLSCLSRSQKTKKEYQISACALLNWLVDTKRAPGNPLAGLELPEVKGKGVRVSRAYTEAEFAKLLSVAGTYALGYQFLLYTACRWSEAHAAAWCDVHLEGEGPYVLFREGTTKDKDRRRVDLKAELAELLHAARNPAWPETDRVLEGRLATYDQFRAHLKKAGIAHKDALGRVLHLHALRKTWQTWAAVNGVNQRAAQDVLGHSDPRLTANVYTDVQSLGMRGEMAKVPWVSASGDRAQWDAQKRGSQGPSMSLSGIVDRLRAVLQVIEGEGVGHSASSNVTQGHLVEMAARAGIEPATK